MWFYRFKARNGPSFRRWVCELYTWYIDSSIWIQTTVPFYLLRYNGIINFFFQLYKYLSHYQPHWGLSTSPPSAKLVCFIVSLALFTDRSKILEFFRAHRDTLVILLKTEVSDLSVSVLEEVCLIVTLGISVLPSVQKTELVRQRNNKLTQGH